MQSFPAFLPLEGRSIAIIGAGPAADAKARLFEGSPATVLRFAETPDAGELEIAALIFIAEADPAKRETALAAARRTRAWVNVVDAAALCDFITPAIVDRGELVIGVSTSGAAPTLARDIRAKIETLVPAAYAKLADLARRMRDRVLNAKPSLADRRAAWESILRGQAGERALTGDLDGAAALAEETLRGARSARGVVHLVGAGPGDPELLTLKALRILQDADIIFHDKLVDARVLDLARRDAERVFVGKSRGDHSVPQREIEWRLIAAARAGKRVVRLKGGDPFIFGRGGEEMEALRAAGVEAHVVPGVTSALGVAAEAQIPLTHRDHAQSVTFVTGHAKDGASAMDWSAFAGSAQTLVVYMGVDTASQTAAALIAAGRSPDTPVAVIENGTTERVKNVRGALRDLPRLIGDAGIVGPALLFIGEVAAAPSALTQAAEDAA
ncbi:MAG: uroporphyrinogen-III C-methyltransferase [Alphaproteobacteria bacterium]|nr:uroporphyrinogen-III C-methyltransferase [Alphaproteobacteria bacterium]